MLRRPVNEGEMVHEALIQSLEMDYANIPMSPNASVRPGDKELCLTNLPKAMNFIGKNTPSGPVLIHCRSGKDRTGMVLAALLIVLQGLTVKILKSHGITLITVWCLELVNVTTDHPKPQHT